MSPQSYILYYNFTIPSLSVTPYIRLYTMLSVPFGMTVFTPRNVFHEIALFTS